MNLTSSLLTGEPGGPSGNHAAVQTWQFYLSEKMEANVQNFGVGGYGPGQALLQLERNLNAGMGAPVVIFSVHEHNLARAVSTLRPFYLPSTGIRLGFKPRFVVEEGVARVLPNPLGEISSVESLLPVTIRPGRGHYSANGNRALAEWIDARLGEVLRR
jgi:hypothetical protein